MIIDTYPIKEGRVYVNGEFAGVAPVTVELKCGPFLFKSRSMVATAEAEGTVSKWSTTFDRSARTVRVRLENDEHHQNTMLSDVANKWINIVPRDGKSDDLLWQQLVDVVTDNFSDIETLNRGSMYLRTAWRVRNFEYNSARTRIVVKRSATDALGFKVMLQAEVAPPKARRPFDNIDYKSTMRIFQPDKETIDFIRDQL